MTDEERALLDDAVSRLARLERIVTANGYRHDTNGWLTGEAAMAQAETDGISLREGLRVLQEVVNKHLLARYGHTE